MVATLEGSDVRRTVAIRARGRATGDDVAAPTAQVFALRDGKVVRLVGQTDSFVMARAGGVLGAVSA